MAGGDAGRALDVVVEPVRRHGELVGIEVEMALLAEILLDQLAQRVDRRVGRRERDAAGARAARGEPRDLDRDQRQQPAHREAEALAREKMLLVKLGAERRRCASTARSSVSGTTGVSGERP